MTNEKEREFTIDFSFLDHKEYTDRSKMWFRAMKDGVNAVKYAGDYR